MKTIHIILLVAMMFPAVLSVGCSKKTEENEVTPIPPAPVPEPEPVTPVEPVTPADLPPGPATERHEEKVKVAENAMEIVPEDYSGETEMRVEVRYFEDAEILKQVRYTIVQAAENNNYRFRDEQMPDRKSVAFLIWSRLSPISIEETITNALDSEGYSVRVIRKSDNLLLVTPE